MMSKTKAIIFFSGFLGVVFLLGGIVKAAGDYGLGDTAAAAELNQYDSDVPTLVGRVIGTGLSMVGVVFFILMVYGGIMWMTDRGKGESAKKALDTIIAAAIGMVIVLASYALTNFVFKSVGTGSGNNNTDTSQEQAISEGSTCSSDIDCTTDTQGGWCISSACHFPPSDGDNGQVCVIDRDCVYENCVSGICESSAP